jgi:hypothetical protein
MPPKILPPKEGARRARERVTISRRMSPPTFFLMAAELIDTKIDLRGGHLTINKGGRQ